ncbi:hypothetical protein [Methanogenium cariaci]|uniref:hypothetical protein n=1 Tax=Methanogenium cariaci TaxID=2197 RepID=UPI00078603DE|nr:hypothetical protein [Methanogenium cariaci]
MTTSELYSSVEPAPDNSKVKLCWYVGAYQDTDITEYFLEEGGIWENGYDDKYIDLVNSIQIGDKIAIKSSYNQQKNLPFDAGNKKVSVMAVKAIGTVTKNYGNGKKLNVEWEKLDNPKKWFLFRSMLTVWKVESQPDDWRYQALLDFTFADKPQDYEQFLHHSHRGGEIWNS